eukprot:6129633-Amphidinium_carterae.1
MNGLLVLVSNLGLCDNVSCKVGVFRQNKRLLKLIATSTTVALKKLAPFWASIAWALKCHLHVQVRWSVDPPRVVYFTDEDTNGLREDAIELREGHLLPGEDSWVTTPKAWTPKARSLLKGFENRGNSLEPFFVRVFAELPSVGKYALLPAPTNHEMHKVTLLLLLLNGVKLQWILSSALLHLLKVLFGGLLSCKRLRLHLLTHNTAHWRGQTYE